MFKRLYFLLILALLFSPLRKAEEWDQSSYQRLLKKGSKLLSLKGPQKIYILESDRIVRIQHIYGEENFVHVLSKTGRPLYKTSLKNVSSFNKAHEIFPKIDPLKIYPNTVLDQEVLPQNSESQWMTFAHFSLEYSSSAFYKDLLQGDQNRLTTLRSQVNQYYIYSKLPVHMGLHLSLQRQSWNDDEAGKASVFGVNWGPTFITSFLKSKESVYNAHLSFFRSLSNQVKAKGESIKLTSIGYQIQLEKEYYLSGRPFTFGLQYRYSKHNVKSLRARNDLINEGDETTVGLSFGHRFNWSL